MRDGREGGNGGEIEQAHAHALLPRALAAAASAVSLPWLRLAPVLLYMSIRVRVRLPGRIHGGPLYVTGVENDVDR